MTTVTKRKGYEIGGQNVGRTTIAEDVTKFSLDQTRAILQKVVNETVAQQTALNNPPTFIAVDGQAGKPLAAVDKKVVVLFGSRMIKGLAAEAESILAGAIASTTKPKSGALRNISAGWQWFYINGSGKGSGPISNPDEIQSFGIRDRLILRPRLNYATVVNQRVAKGGGLSIKTRGKRGKKGTAENVSKRNQNLGFMRFTAETLRRNPRYRSEFSIYVAFTRRFAVSGELAKYGTAELIIRPRLKFGRR